MQKIKPHRPRKRGPSAIQLIVAALVSIAVGLLLTAFQLTQQLAHRPPARALHSPAALDAAKFNSNAVESKKASTAKLPSPYEPWPPLQYDPAVTPGVLRQDGKYAKNRIYCMVPFVWRRDFYDISEFLLCRCVISSIQQYILYIISNTLHFSPHPVMATWGSRCDQIHFFTDSIVNLSGDFVRDFITGDQETYRPYWEYEEGTFPENVVFMNMTRSWDGCTDPKTGKAKIW